MVRTRSLLKMSEMKRPQKVLPTELHDLTHVSKGFLLPLWDPGADDSAQKRANCGDKSRSESSEGDLGIRGTRDQWGRDSVGVGTPCRWGPCALTEHDKHKSQEGPSVSYPPRSEGMVFISDGASHTLHSMRSHSHSAPNALVHSYSLYRVSATAMGPCCGQNHRGEYTAQIQSPILLETSGRN